MPLEKLKCQRAGQHYPITESSNVLGVDLLFAYLSISLELVIGCFFHLLNCLGIS